MLAYAILEVLVYTCVLSTLSFLRTMQKQRALCVTVNSWYVYIMHASAWVCDGYIFSILPNCILVTKFVSTYPHSHSIVVF